MKERIHYTAVIFNWRHIRATDMNTCSLFHSRTCGWNSHEVYNYHGISMDETRYSSYSTGGYIRPSLIFHKYESRIRWQFQKWVPSTKFLSWSQTRGRFCRKSRARVRERQTLQFWYFFFFFTTWRNSRSGRQPLERNKKNKGDDGILSLYKTCRLVWWPDQRRAKTCY